MKKILIRGWASPYDHIDADSAMICDPTGTNAGNLLYAYSVARLLTCSGYEICFDRYKGELGQFGPADIDYINAEYDAYLIPLADAFRPDWSNQLAALSSLVRRLKIPCIVVGAGLRSDYEPDIVGPHPFDDAARNFVASVLDKSASIALRGEISEDYLTNLGFSQGVQHEAIGCPSMYALATNLHTRKLCFSSGMKVVISQSGIISPAATDMLVDIAHRYPQAHLVVQNYPNIRRAYLGTRLFGQSALESWRFMYEEGRVLGFVRALPWIDHLRNSDLCTGGKLHGSIAGILGGAPTLVIPSDARTRELVSFHQLPHIPSKDIPEGVSIEDLVTRVNFSSHLSVQRDNFGHFLSFLRKNGLDIPEASTLERAMLPEQDTLLGEGTICSIESVSRDEALRRHAEYSKRLMKQMQGITTERNQLLAERDALQRQLDQEQIVLQRKSVQASLKAADTFGRLLHRRNSGTQ